MTDRIVLSGIEVFAYHGVLEEEQSDGQLFAVDVVVEVDLTAAAASDDLDETIDYGLLADRIHERVAGERWNLIERVASRVAELVLEDPRVTSTEVTIHKPQAPIAVPFRDVTVTLQRSR